MSKFIPGVSLHLVHGAAMAGREAHVKHGVQIYSRDLRAEPPLGFESRAPWNWKLFSRFELVHDIVRVTNNFDNEVASLQQIKSVDLYTQHYNTTHVVTADCSGLCIHDDEQLPVHFHSTVAKHIHLMIVGQCIAMHNGYSWHRQAVKPNCCLMC